MKRGRTPEEIRPQTYAQYSPDQTTIKSLSELVVFRDDAPLPAFQGSAGGETPMDDATTWMELGLVIDALQNLTGKNIRVPKNLTRVEIAETLTARTAYHLRASYGLACEMDGSRMVLSADGFSALCVFFAGALNRWPADVQWPRAFRFSPSELVDALAFRSQMVEVCQ